MPRRILDFSRLVHFEFGAIRNDREQIDSLFEERAGQFEPKLPDPFQIPVKTPSRQLRG
jgi:hypothetical protein